MTTAEILREARTLIDTPEKWTKYTFARNLGGERVREDDSRAVSFCASGALARVTKDPNPAGLPAYDALRAVIDTQEAVSSFNDREETMHEDVLAAFDRAIEAEEARP